MNLIPYIRVSSNSHADGDGYDRQLVAIKAFCEKHNAFCLNPFFDKAVSGTIEGMDRPEFAKMLDFIAKGKNAVAGIVVERMDRLARDLMVSEFMLKECRDRGIKVFCADRGELVDMASDGSDPTQVLIRQILAALAQWERAMLVAKMAGARARIKAETGRCEGNKPFGHYPGEMGLARLVVQLRSSLMSFRAIARMINEDSIYKTRRGGALTAATVQDIWEKFHEKLAFKQESEDSELARLDLEEKLSEMDLSDKREGV